MNLAVCTGTVALMAREQGVRISACDIASRTVSWAGTPRPRPGLTVHWREANAETLPLARRLVRPGPVLLRVDLPTQTDVALAELRRVLVTVMPARMQRRSSPAHQASAWRLAAGGWRDVQGGWGLASS